jgi:hypothetical protein
MAAAVERMRAGPRGSYVPVRQSLNIKLLNRRAIFLAGL